MPSLQIKNQFASGKATLGRKVNGRNSDGTRSLLIFLRIGCEFFGNWPLRVNVAKWKIALYKILYSVYFANELWGLLGITNGLYCCEFTIRQFMKSFVEMTFMLETLFNLIYYRLRESEFQRLTLEMQRFFETSNYLNHIKSVYYIFTVNFIIGVLYFALTPLFTENQLTPLNTVYFKISRDDYWSRCIIYALNVLHIVTPATLMFLDLLVISIIWHVACKFALLGSKLKNLNETKAKVWIKEHQDLISYAQEVNRTFAPLAFKSTIAVTVFIIVSGLTIINDISFVELPKYMTVTVFAVLRFLACSWAADKMTEMARDIACDIYGVSWTEAMPNVRKDILIIIQRCQKPITIRMIGFQSAWSLKFCGQVLYTTFTFFLTLKAALRE